MADSIQWHLNLYPGFWNGVYVNVCVLGGQVIEYSMKQYKPTLDNDMVSIWWACISPDVQQYCSVEWPEQWPAPEQTQHCLIPFASMPTVPATNCRRERQVPLTLPRGSAMTGGDQYRGPRAFSKMHYTNKNYRKEPNRMTRDRRKRPGPGPQPWEWEEIQTPPLPKQTPNCFPASNHTPEPSWSTAASMPIWGGEFAGHRGWKGIWVEGVFLRRKHRGRVPSHQSHHVLFFKNWKK